MFFRPRKLSQKIVGLLLTFFVVASLAIGWTLHISWQLEGVAAAINDAGSQRMRTYRFGYLMSQAVGGERASLDQLQQELERFDQVQRDLRQGDPARPLASPRDGAVGHRLNAVDNAWQANVRPLIVSYLEEGGHGRRLSDLQDFRGQLEGFVALINETVLAMEHSYTHDTNLLRSLQAVLVLWTVLGSFVLIYKLLHWVIRPVNILHSGIRRMSGSDLTVRLPVASEDEFGELAQGFNQMAEHLQSVYDTLEERVEAETRNLAQRNHELRILYATTAFLSEPAPIQELCDGFLERILSALGADAGAVRLYDPEAERFRLSSSLGLSDAFISAEQALTCIDCLCGDVQQGSAPQVFGTDATIAGRLRGNCLREGFATASAFGIVNGRQRLGVFNLYFRREHAWLRQEIDLLDTLGQHLGVAIETRRLRSREKELAVSEERNLLAQELHDSIAQGLVFLNIQVQLLQDSLKKGRLEEVEETAGQLREGIQESYDHVRELLLHFRTRARYSDLDSAIQGTLEKFEAQTGIATAFERVGSGAPLPPADELQIMHILQESLSNVRKHADASQVRVVVRRGSGRLEISVRDNGCGFDPDNEPKVHSERHVGLKIMNERAYRIGGECRITSQPGAGTLVTFSLPRDARESEHHGE